MPAPNRFCLVPNTSSVIVLNAPTLNEVARIELPSSLPTAANCSFPTSQGRCRSSIPHPGRSARPSSSCGVALRSESQPSALGFSPAGSKLYIGDARFVNGAAGPIRIMNVATRAITTDGFVVIIP
jgi:hypothetical protein